MPSKIAKTEPRGAVPASSFKYNPLRHVRWLYTTFVQGLFGFQSPGNYHWAQDLQDTEIVITGDFPLNTDTLNDRPGITFTRAPIGFFQLGFDDMLTFDQATGQKVKSLLIPGTMVINCCSRNDLESEHIAWVVAEQLWMQRDLLMKAGFYDVGRNLQIGAPSVAGQIVTGDQADEWFTTSIVSPYHFYRTGSVMPLNTQVLSALEMRMKVLPPRAIQRPGVPQTGADLPVEIKARPPSPVLPQKTSPLDAVRVPHPLNPAQLVTIEHVRDVKPPMMRGRRLPIVRVDVGDSEPAKGITVNVKV